MAKLTCRKKLQVELRGFLSSPPPYLPLVCVNEENICEWHYLLQGPPDTPYAGGWYIGKLKFPPDYPFAPPAIMMLTPSGRFKPATRLCLSISDFHPESWNPMWGVAAVLTGLLSFMLEETPTTGAVESCSAEERRALAADSVRFNMATPALRGLFPDLPRLAEEAQTRQAAAAASGGAGGVAAAVAAAAEALAKALRLGAAAGGAAPGGEAPAERRAAAGVGLEDDADIGGGGSSEQVGPAAPSDEGTSPAVAAALASARASLAAAAPEEARRCAEAALDALSAAATTAADVASYDRAALLRVAAAAAVATGDLGAAADMLDDASHALAGPSAASFAAFGVDAARAADGAKTAGNEAFKRREWGSAADLYRRGLAALPAAWQCAALHANVAAALAAGGDAAGCEAAARSALAVQAGHLKARRRLADALLQRGAPREAARHYALLTAALPDDAGLAQAALAASRAAADADEDAGAN